jgi:hypothetical protein
MLGIDKHAAQGDLPADDLIEIHDPEIDPEAIMAKIRARIQERRMQLGYARPQFSTFGGSTLPDRPEDIAYDPELFDHLESVNEQYIMVPSESDLQPSPATRLPLLGALWSMIREQAHALVLFYTNRSASHQTGVNQEIISIINGLTALNIEQQRRIERLENELKTVRNNLAEQKGE